MGSSARPSGPEGRYEVVHERVAVRSQPSMTAPLRSSLRRGHVVHGRPHVVDGQPWLRLGSASCEELGVRGLGAWMLLHGQSVGLGALLQPVVTPSAEPSGAAGAADVARRPKPAGAGGEYTVTHDRVVKRKDPDLEAAILSVLSKGSRVKGAPFDVEGLLWLKLEQEGWMLIDGRPLGLGALLAPSAEVVGVEQLAAPAGNAADVVTVTVTGAATGEALVALELPLSANVLALKQAIAQACCEPLYSQRLIADTRMLEDDEQLEVLPYPRHVQLLRLPYREEAGRELLQHAAAGDLLGVEAALSALASPNFVQPAQGATMRVPKGSTALLVAALHGRSLEVVQRLCEASADVGSVNEAGATPLHLASQQGDLKIVQCLCDASASPNAQMHSGASPLHLAARQGHWKVARGLVSLRAAVDATNMSGATPLYLASQDGHIPAVRILCEAGASLNLTKQGGAAPLHIAAQKGHTEAVRYLCEQGADKDAAIGEASEVIAGKDKSLLDGATPLILAAFMGHTVVVQCLSEAKADAERTSSTGYTACHVAVKRRKSEIVQLLGLTQSW